MAITVSQLVKTVVGNQRKVVFRVTPDATATALVSSLHTIEDFSVAIQSAATQSGNSASPRFAMNEGETGTSIAGTLGMSSVVSGDEYIISLYGK